MRKIKKNQFLAGFAVVVLILGIVRLLFPSIDDDRQPKAKETTTPVAVADTVKEDEGGEKGTARQERTTGGECCR